MRERAKPVWIMIALLVILLAFAVVQTVMRSRTRAGFDRSLQKEADRVTEEVEDLTTDEVKGRFENLLKPITKERHE